MVTLTKTQFLFFGALNSLVLVGDVAETLSSAVDGELLDQGAAVYSYFASFIDVAAIQDMASAVAQWVVV